MTFPTNPLNPDNKPILCLDFDGVIHTYTSKWTSETEIHDTITEGFFWWALSAQEIFHLVIYSSRSATREGRLAMSEWLARQMRQWWNGVGDQPELHVEFMSEKPPAFLQIDDRALTFNGDWSALPPADLLNFKPWNRR